MSGTNASYLYAGGLIGLAENVTLTGPGTNTNSNTGSLLWTVTADQIGVGYYLGGILGYANNSSIQDFASSGAVNVAKSGTPKEYWLNVGGIVGRIDGNNLFVKNCTSSGKLDRGNNGTFGGSETEPYQTNFGGIVGCVNGASEVSGCTYSGALNNNGRNNYTNNDDADELYGFNNGGIVGLLMGTDHTLLATVDDCHTTGNNVLAAGRGFIGGLVGYAKYAEIKNSDSSRNISNYTHYAGGLVGKLFWSSITDCEFTGSAIAASVGRFIGGVAAFADANSSISGCTVANYTESHDRSYIPIVGGICGGVKSGVTISGNTNGSSYADIGVTISAE